MHVPILSILVVDDNEINVLLTRSMLSLMRLDSDTASNGMEAIRLFERKPYDLVILDIEMPIMDGFETAKRIRRMCESANQPVIYFSSSNAKNYDADRCRQCEVDGNLPKPIHLEELKKIIHKAYHKLQER